MSAAPLFSYDRRAEQGPCDCPVALAEAPNNWPHTLEAHRRESCGGPSRPDPCGGCYDCVCAQWSYYERLASVEQEEAKK